MNYQHLQYLRIESDNERLALSEIAEIEELFATIPDELLRDERENAMASDMIDEIEAHLFAKIDDMQFARIKMGATGNMALGFIDEGGADIVVTTTDLRNLIRKMEALEGAK